MTTKSHIRFEHVEIDFTIYQTSARLLKKTIFKTAVGGFIRSSEKNNRISVRALQDINLNITSGDRVALLGVTAAIVRRPE